jgi:hypothetical protein
VGLLGASNMEMHGNYGNNNIGKTYKINLRNTCDKAYVMKLKKWMKNIEGKKMKTP